MMNENNDMLTIMIPTYNRREGLLNTLKSLANQTNQNFSVFVCDNKSDYDVRGLLSELPKDFANKCTFMIREENVGQNINVTEIMNYSHTNWVWTLADDDVVYEDAVETIYESISDDVAIIDFVIRDEFEGERLTISSIDDFIDFYKEKEKPDSLWHGDLIFYSNKIYNLKYVKQYIEESLFYSYSYLGLMIAYIRTLESGKALLLLGKKIAEHGTKYSNNLSWSYYKAYLASRTLMDVRVDIDEKKKNQLIGLLIFDIRDLIYSTFVLSQTNKPPISSNYFEVLYVDAYKYFLKSKYKILLLFIAKIYKRKWGYSFLRKILPLVL